MNDLQTANLNSKSLIDKNETMTECLYIVEGQENDPDMRVLYMKYACMNGHLEIVEGLLKHDFDVNSRCNLKNTALHYAVLSNETAIVKILLENGALPDLSNKNSFTPLHLASINGNNQVVKELLNYKIDVNFETKDGKNALDFAAINGHLNIVKELLKAGAKAYNYIDDGFPTFEKLPRKLSQNNLEIVVEILLRHPHPLHQAILHFENPEINIILNRLLESGISPHVQDRNGNTALHVTVMDDNDNFQVVAKLLKQGVNIEAKNCKNETPLHSAFFKNNLDYFEELLKYGANPNHLIDDTFRETLLHSACQEENITKVKILLEHGANINSLDYYNQTPLYAAIIGTTDDWELIVKELLQNGADVNQIDLNNETVIYHANEKVDISEDLLQDLLKLCTNPIIKNFHDGRTPLHTASDCGFDSNVKDLLKYGADPYIRDQNGFDS